MNIFQKFDETRAQSGVGSAIYFKNESGLFSILFPVETVPKFAGTPEGIEINVTTSDTITKIDGKITLEDAEFEAFAHRDNIRKLESLKGKVVEFLVYNADFTGERINGKITYSLNERTSGEASKLTCKIIPTESLGVIDNCHDLLQPTCKFLNEVPNIVKIKHNGNFKLKLETEPTNATVAVKSETETVATVQESGGTVTINGVKKGSAVVTLKLTESNHATRETTILVIVEQA